MALDKAVDSTKLNNSLEYTADHIRLKTGGSADIPFDYAGEKGFGAALDAIPSKAAQTYTPGTTDQVIAAGQMLSGAQTILGDPDLIAANIAAGVTIFGVTGTYSGFTWDVYNAIFEIDADSEAPWSLTLPRMNSIQLANNDYSADGISFYGYYGSILVKAANGAYPIEGPRIMLALEDIPAVYVLDNVMDAYNGGYLYLCAVTQCTQSGNNFLLSGKSWTAKATRGTKTGTVNDSGTWAYPADGVQDSNWYVLRT